MLSLDTTYSNFIDFLIINNQSSNEAKSFIWSPDECNYIISLSKTLPEHSGTVSNEKIDYQMRKVTKYKIPNDDTNGWIYDKIAQTIINSNSFFWNYDIDFIETIELLKYSYNPSDEIQDHYSKHSDYGPNMNKRKLSYSALLSDPTNVTGGDLTFYLEKEITMPAQQGQVVIFPSFQFHSVSEVTEGTRWSLVTWISGRPFK